MLAMRTLINDVGTEMAQFKDLKNVPNDQVRNFRNDMYLTSEALRIMQKSGKPEISTADAATLKNYKGHIDKATRFIPLWVKVAVAIALGLGTMVGWKRIVVTVGEKIGKNHLTYAQGAAAANHRHGHHRRGRLFWLARQYHSRFIFGRRGHDGGKSFWLAVGHCSQLADGLGPDPAGGHDSLRILVLDLPQTLLARGFASPVAAQHVYPAPFGAGPLNVQP
jgi:Phosphate transporter family